MKSKKYKYIVNESEIKTIVKQAKRFQRSEKLQANKIPCIGRIYIFPVNRVQRAAYCTPYTHTHTDTPWNGIATRQEPASGFESHQLHILQQILPRRNASLKIKFIWLPLASLSLTLPSSFPPLWVCVCDCGTLPKPNWPERTELNEGIFDDDVMPHIRIIQFQKTSSLGRWALGECNDDSMRSTHFILAHMVGEFRFGID